MNQLLLDTWAANYKKYKRYCQVKFKEGVDADDVLQLVALSICKHKGQVEKPDQFIIRAIIHAAINYRRSNRRIFQAAELTDKDSITYITPESLLMGKQLREKLTGTLRGETKLDPILRLRLLKGLTNPEIGQEMGLTSIQVSSNIKVAHFYKKLDYLKELL